MRNTLRSLKDDQTPRKRQGSRITRLHITKIRIKRGRRKELYHCVTVPKSGGHGRTRRFFKFTTEGKLEAETFLQMAKQQQANYGTAAFSISDALRAETVECAKKLAAGGHSLTDATRFFLAHLKAQENSISVSEAMERLIASRQKSGRSERYCHDLRLRLKRFATDFQGTTVGTITARQLDEWLGNLPVAPGTRNTFRRDLRTLFSYCEKHGYCRTNEAKKTERAKDVDKPAGILTVQQTIALLNACDDDILPYVAVSLFAGLRAAEVQKLDWSEIDLDSGHIEVAAAKSKTSRRRLVPISDSLAAWLRPIARLRGAVTPERLRMRFDAVKAGARLQKWPPHAMRHSYGSYRLAQCHDAARVSLEMGNSPQMVFAHYRELVKPKDAERYWKIAPASAANLVAMRA
jgi:integrase